MLKMKAELLENDMTMVRSVGLGVVLGCLIFVALEKLKVV